MRLRSDRHESEQLWARHKYLVLSHSAAIYKQIREYLKQDTVFVEDIQHYIDQATALPESRGQVINAFQHVWGYFKKKASQKEREDFMYLLSRYEYGKIPQEQLILAVRNLLEKYPNPYLQNSSLLYGGYDETLASRTDS